jgi:hypothetical protein
MMHRVVIEKAVTAGELAAEIGLQAAMLAEKTVQATASRPRL